MPPGAIDPRVPRDLETIVLKALAKRPADRYATAAELAEDLARFLNHEPVKARRISPVGRLWRVARRHPGITSVSRPPPRRRSWRSPPTPTFAWSPSATRRCKLDT